MNGKSASGFNSHFNNEQACITYLFRRRWPLGFKCPFCGSVQNKTAPAFTVVCRYCRKQTSITAQTLMHGSKKSLAAWLQVAWLFCSTEQGLSARGLQRLMGLSCYQTAWHWLQKIRTAAALAESAPCRGLVLFDITALAPQSLARPQAPAVGIAYELNARKTESARVRFQVMESTSTTELLATIGRLVLSSASLQLGNGQWAENERLADSYHLGEASAEQRRRGEVIVGQVEGWLQQVFSKAVAATHLQAYLDEFGFHHNTAFWSDRQAVLDHLATALLTPATRIIPLIGKTR